MAAPRPGGDGRIPLLPRVYVPRRLLSERLETACRGAVTAVVAPAGAGKTLGVAGWLRHTGRTDDTLWVAATGELDAGRLHQLLETTRDQTATGRPTYQRLVVDDAHRLPVSAVAYLDQELDLRPDRLSIVLLSQWDLPLNRLVPELLGHLTVLRGGILRLDEEEATALVAGHAGIDSPAAVAAVMGRAEGWCAPVVLIAKAAAAAADPLAAVDRYAAGGPGVVTQVADEVFAALQPRERHLLLCLVGESRVTAETAERLSADPLAGDVLAGLETTGLLVTRDTDLPSTPLLTGEDAGMAYRIHPILVESARRSLLAGGVEAGRAKASVLAAARADQAGGDPVGAFTRLVAVDDPAAALEVLVDEGPRLLLRGHAAAVHAFARRYPDAVGADRRAWPSLALERWLNGDSTAAERWRDRFLSTGPAPETADPAVACLRLMRARLGLESSLDALDHATSVASAAADRTGSDPFLPMLLVELGATESWVGRLADAEAHLASAVLLARAQDLPAVTAQAQSHLALTEFVQGREHACLKLADEALHTLAGQPWHPPTTAARAHLARDLALVQRLSWPATSTQPDRRPVHHPADAATPYWTRLLDVRRMLLRGEVTEAERALDAPWDTPALPAHLRAVALVERALQAAVASDRDTLAGVAGDLGRIEAAGEASFAAALRADLVGDARRAEELLAQAAAEATLTQPPVVPMALACRAQILDALGEPDEALRDLSSALTATEVRRNGSPFLGWSRAGTPMRLLLARVADGTGTGWAAELAAADHPGLASFLGPTTPTPRERRHPPQTVVPPVLSPREREVLLELARGATYADIAANLLVSENTVKTHVSSLYAKLAVGRRSDALAVARTLRLV